MDKKLEAILNQPPPALCNTIGCKNPPKFKVCVSLAVNTKHTPAVSTPLIHVCGDHVDVKWEELVTDATWELFEKTFTAMGKMKPLKKYSHLEIIPL